MAVIAGGFTAILMTLFLRLTDARPNRIETALGSSELPKIRTFLGDFASRSGWGEEMADRLGSVAEEALLSLARGRDRAEGRGEDRPRLALAAHGEKGDAVLEFVVAPGEENLQDRIAMLEEPSDEASMGREVSLRLLRHLSSSVRHRQYHDTDVITVRVETPRDSAEGSSRERRPRRSARSRINPLSSGPARTRPGSRAS